MIKTLNTRFFLRALIIFLWFTIIIGFLFSSSLGSFFKEEKSINVAVWADMVDPVVVKQFEQATGIRVYLSYIESNEELYTRFKATGGQGYDIIFASDHMIEIMKNDGYLKKINKAKLDMWDRLDKRLLGLYFDPENEYSIPHSWYVYGLGVDKDYFEQTSPEPSWGLAFDTNRVPDRIGMPNVPREAILITAQYLFGTIDNLGANHIKMIKDVMIAQKKHVESYTEFRADYLLMSKISPVVVSSTVYLWRALQLCKDIIFLLPKESVFVLIDNVAVSHTTKKDDFVYQFINFLYKPDVIKQHFDIAEIFPATNDLFPLLENDANNETMNAIIEAHKTSPETWEFFRNVISEEKLNDIWIALKST